MDPASKPRRVDQILASLGYCSRSGARTFVNEGRIAYSGKPVDDPGSKARPGELTIDGVPLDHPNGILVLLNKPLGYVCSHSRDEGETIYDLLPEQWLRRNPVPSTVGRLDKDTSGALIVTDQTALIHRFTSPKHKVPKLYQVTVDRPLDPGLVELFAAGTLMLEGEEDPCRPAELRITDEVHADLVLVEGRYHQVRRMFASQGYFVSALHRERFGSVTVEGLAPGSYRDLSVSEVTG